MLFDTIQNTTFDNFANKLSFQLQNSNQSSTEPLIGTDEQQLEGIPPKNVVKASNFCVKATNFNGVETFKDKIKHKIFHPKNVNTKVFHNIIKKEREFLKEIKILSGQGSNLL